MTINEFNNLILQERIKKICGENDPRYNSMNHREYLYKFYAHIKTLSWGGQELLTTMFEKQEICHIEEMFKQC